MSAPVVITLTNDSLLVKRLVASSPNKIRKVSRRIMNGMATELERSLAGSIPRAAGTSVGGFRRVRAYRTLGMFTARRSRPATVWLGGNRIPAKFGGKMSQDAKGARAGNHYFAGSFIAKMKNGYTSIFHRTSGGKLKQDFITVPPIYPHALKKVKSLKPKYSRILRYEVEKAIK